ncbi:MAG TPA: bis-aminopropyl spermidine synthase family protein [Acidimicrobiia bacterium]|nr:bis-aminopropyl spermidine synthase family protein [Acidimicrobiia bacterium]
MGGPAFAPDSLRSMPELPQAVAGLRREWGLDFTRVRRVLTRLADGATLSQLVSASGLPRREVESVLHALGPFMKTDNGRYRLPDFESLSSAAPDRASLTDRMAALAAGLPPSRWRLDHVPATADTMARRASYLAEQYELDGASVLCLGDHDLTSLAVALVAPEAELTVVDIDEPILDHVMDSAATFGCPLTAAWADLRLALPASLVGTADLVFMDPPYTTEGIRLFLIRALEALRPSGHERLALCFGTGERHLVKALEVQALLGDLRLALEAMLPGFNHYDGAEAIGARSDLYICRPTKGAKVGKSAPGSRRSKASKAAGPRIYTRGPTAVEASAHTLPEPIRTAAVTAAGEGPVLLVGDGWGDTAVNLPEFFSRVVGWATAARPGPFPFTGTPVINTSPDYGGAALRTLALTAPERAVLIVPRRGLPDGDLLTAAYDLAAVPTGPGGDPAVLIASRHDRRPADAAEAVLRHILLHPGAKVVNAWRDALLTLARDAGQPMTKNEARASIAVDSLPASLRRLRSWELPQSALRQLPALIARSTGNNEAPR